MWHCPECGKAIDDEFDTCWNCGAKSDRTADSASHADPKDPAMHEWGNETRQRAAANDAKQDERLDAVELCSAADSVEAFAIADALEAEGIKASVVGDALQAIAAGGVPLGEAGSPRVWVRRKEEKKAREILEQFRSEQEDESKEATDAELAAKAEASAEEPAEELLPETRPRREVSLLSVLLVLAGLASIGIGTWRAVANGSLLARYSKRADAVRIGVEQWSRGRWKQMQMPDLQEHSVYSREVYWRAQYEYAADGNPHRFQVETKRPPARTMAVLYDPTDPANCRIDAILPPVWCVVFGSLVGVLLFFLAYQFR